MSSTMGTSTKVTTVSRQLALNMNASTTAACVCVFRCVRVFFLGHTMQ